MHAIKSYTMSYCIAVCHLKPFLRGRERNDFLTLLNDYTDSKQLTNKVKNLCISSIVIFLYFWKKDNPDIKVGLEPARVANEGDRGLSK